MPISKAIDRLKRSVRSGQSSGFVVLKDGLHKYSIETAGRTMQINVGEMVMSRRQIVRTVIEKGLTTSDQAEVAVLIAADVQMRKSQKRSTLARTRDSVTRKRCSNVSEPKTGTNSPNPSLPR